ISASILNKSIETAQKRVEQRNYMVRKHTLEYDDVMNKQRQEIYSFRNDLIHTKNPVVIAEEVLENLCYHGTDQFFTVKGREGGWNPEGFREWLHNSIPVSFEEGYFDDERADKEMLAKKAFGRILATFHEKVGAEKKKMVLLSGNPDFDATFVTDHAIQSIMVRTIDHHWQEHLLAMDHLRSDVHLRAVGQKDPLMEFKHEAFNLFDRFTQHIRVQTAHALFKFEIVPSPRPEMQDMLDSLHLETDRSLVSDLEEEEEEEDTTEPNGNTEVTLPVQPIHVPPKVNRNDPCPCGSSKKYKKCCSIGPDSDD
ncbi:MAG: secA, partial [Chlamydiia bacterium]|nr:secA [Chlamydiia bacterium]